MRRPRVLQSDAPATFLDSMKRRLILPLLIASVAAALFAATQGAATPAPQPPQGFFGIAPQAGLTDEDAAYMSAGGIESVRVPLAWSLIQPTAKGAYQWGGVDDAVAVAARHGLRVLPFVYNTPRWLAAKPTTLPVNGKARTAWVAFLQAAVKRYGPGGEFWAAHLPGVVKYEPPIAKPLPIRTWQIWNEANFFYFAYPVSPQRYAKLVTLSSQAIKATDSGAKVILTGLFGKPTASGARGMPAADFLAALYRVPGIKSRFDGVALHPYAVDTETLEELVEGIHEVTVENHDRVPLYITEMGWGSQNDFNQVAFEQGVQGQVRELRDAYAYLLDNQRRLDLQQVDWFSWKDAVGSCNFCDSVGLFRTGPRFKPKPAWRAFVALAGGRARP
jgi:glycosyl hydrolase family 42 (putative beta-galactosidase)